MRFSLRAKTIIFIILFAVILSGTGLFVGSRLINELVDTDYKKHADQLAKTTSFLVDGDQVKSLRDQVMEIYNATSDRVGSEKWGTKAFNDYTAKFFRLMSTPEFKELHDQLAKVQDVNDVECAYLIYVDAETRNAIYIVDAAEEDPCTPGVFDPVYEQNYESIDNPDRGFPAYITDTGYGWLLTSSAPVYDSNGKVAAFAAVDISMDMIRDKQSSYFFIMLGVFIGLIVVTCFIVFFLVNHHLVKPIRKLSKAAQQYCQSDVKDTHIGFEELNIRSHDEIGELSNSMKQMERDLNKYIDNLVKTREQLVVTRERAAEMSKMASKDSLTGLRNKRAYDLDAVRLDDDIRVSQAEFGIVMVDMNYLKKTNDTYGHDKGDSAICMTSRIICDTFKHSPVYRVGGDEFVVIIQNTDYHNINDLVRRFKESVSQKTNNTLLNPWERISAAIGFAIYDETVDQSAEDVFKRADEKMYEDKKRMKEK